MGLSALSLVAPGDIITSAEQNKSRTNFGVLDARTGGDAGAADKMLVSDGATSAAWVARLTAVLNALGYTPINKAGDTGIGDLTLTGDLSANDATLSGSAGVIGAVSAGVFNGGSTSSGVVNAKEVNVGSDGIDSAGVIAGASTVSAGAWAGGTIVSGQMNVLEVNVGATGIESDGPITSDGTITGAGFQAGASGVNGGSGGFNTTGPYQGGDNSTGTDMEVIGLLVGAHGIATVGTVAIGGQEVYWSGNPPPSSAGGQLVGEVRQLAATSLTAANAAGWLLCDGQAVSRTTHVALFGALGGTFGTGDGSTTFNVPDLRGKFPLGVDGSHALGSTGGAATVNLQHNHSGAPMTISGTAAASGSTLNGRFTAGGANALPDNHTHAVSGTVGGNTADSLSTTQSVMNPYLALRYIIYSGVPT